MAMTAPMALSAGSLKGTNVRNRAGEDLGHLEEIMIDVNTGNIAYVVLSFGGILGIGDKLFAVPWASIDVNTEDETILMEADKDLLENAPGFDKNDWPQTPNGEWYHEVYSYYDVDPYWMPVT